MTAAHLNLALATLIAAGALVIFVDLAIGGRRVPSLRDWPALATGPMISVIVAARDEGPHIERALGSLLDQTYQNYEIIAVNDRSADDTGAVLDRLAATSLRLHAMHVASLPPGWLGKNHALHIAAAAARGEILLFTDADVVFDRSALGRTASMMDGLAADHLTLSPALDVPTWPLALVVNFFILWFSIYIRPWRASSPRSKRHVGIGAFNAIRTSLYRSFGGHAPIALRPDDDLKLGKLVKQAGGRQIVGRGSEILQVRWYATLPEMVRGLRKNSFAALEYSTLGVAGAVVAQLLFNVWPFAGVALSQGPARTLYAVAVALLLTMYAAAATAGSGGWWLAPLYPVAALILVYIMASATARTLIRGGIEWRGTFYALEELRKNVV